jgi:coenzyme F420 biosynthesis associated uncharacterized protein
MASYDTPKRGAPSRKAMAVTVFTGALIGIAVGQRLKAPIDQSENAADIEIQPMIDWDRVRSIAVSMNRGLALTERERARATEDYRARERRCIPIVSAYTGITLNDVPERTFAVDRVDWVEANITSFKRMFSLIEAMNNTPASNSTLNVWLGSANRTVLSGEIALLLAYLARHVLGQYDLALLGREPVDTGTLYYVEPNIRAIEETLKVPGDEFRTWLVLHEITHAFEFEGVPWLRDHFNGLLESYMELMQRDAEQLRQGWTGFKAMITRAREQRGDDVPWLEAIMTPEQRVLFTQMQAVMCMVEGYSNHVMNAVGRDVLPRYDAISKAFERRRAQKSQVDTLIARLTGMNMKLEQYRLGEEFIDAIVATHGHDGAKQIWVGPEYLPTMEEIRDPALWKARVL